MHVIHSNHVRRSQIKMAKETKEKRSMLDALEAGEQADKEFRGATGGGNIYGKVLPEIGWKIFVSGLSNEESFFAFDPFDADSKKDAFEEAKQSVPEGGKTPVTAVQFTVFKNSVVGRDVSGWQNPTRVFTTPQWTDSYKKIIKPTIAELEKQGKTFTWGEETWALLSGKPDPTGRKKDNYKFDASQPESDSNPRQTAEYVTYLADLFDSEEEMQAAAPDTAVTEAEMAAKENGAGSDENPLDAVKNDPEFKAALIAIAQKPKRQQESLLTQLSVEWLNPESSYAATIMPQLKELAGIK